MRSPQGLIYNADASPRHEASPSPSFSALTKMRAKVCVCVCVCVGYLLLRPALPHKAHAASV